jgi:hypothetical protein
MELPGWDEEAGDGGCGMEDIDFGAVKDDAWAS